MPVKAASAEALERWGCGAGASRLMSGTLGLHEELEGKLAALVGCERALVLGSGYLTNVGVMTTLGGKRHPIFADRLCHASIVDGALLSGAELHRYRHNDTGHLEALLVRYAAAGGSVVELVGQWQEQRLPKCVDFMTEQTKLGYGGTWKSIS